VRRRALVLALALAAALAQAACGNRESIRGGGATVGTTLTIYSSLPSPARGSARDMVEGEKLALAEAHGKAGEYTINFSSLDEAGEGARQRMRRAADAARTAMVDTQTAAVIGTVDSAGARASIPLLNAAGFLHVSLGAGYPGFTGRLGTDEPQRWFPAGGRTFARLVGDDRAQAPALVRAAGTRRIVVEAEGGEDAAALAGEVRRAAAAAGVKVVAEAGRDSAVIYAGEDAVAAAEVAASIARGTPGARVVLPDALVRNGVEALLTGSAARRAVLVSSAPEPGSTPALREFEAAFERAYGRRPGRYAALGHAAMETVLAALDRAAADDRAGQRRRVLREYFRDAAAETVAGPLRVLPSGAAAQPRFTTFRLPKGDRG
jgi:ABC-type branched-subunit amino acid transport system substrate-binding protein